MAHLHGASHKIGEQMAGEGPCLCVVNLRMHSNHAEIGADTRPRL